MNNNSNMTLALHDNGAVLVEDGEISASESILVGYEDWAVPADWLWLTRPRRKGLLNPPQQLTITGVILAAKRSQSFPLTLPILQERRENLAVFRDRSATKNVIAYLAAKDALTKARIAGCYSDSTRNDALRVCVVL
jgi:hypothetical protein